MSRFPKQIKKEKGAPRGDALSCLDNARHRLQRERTP